MARKVGPKRSSKPAWPRMRIDFARQWYVNRAYSMVAMETTVNKKAEMKAGRSPKFSMPMARAPRIMVKFSHDRKVRSLAKKTLGSTRVGRAIRLPRQRRDVSRLFWTRFSARSGRMVAWRNHLTWRGLEEGLAGHCRRYCGIGERL